MRRDRCRRPLRRHRVVVAERDDRVVAYAASGAHRPRAAYDTTVETSVYVAPDLVGGGVGHTLYGALFEALSRQELHRAVAGITLPNDASVRLHESFGFNLVGRFTDQGRKFGRYWDVAGTSVRWTDRFERVRTG